MFDIGFSEILLVFVIGLVVLGPERLPGVVKTAARWIRTVRSMSAAVQQQISDELQLEEMKKDLNAGISSAGKAKSGLEAELNNASSALNEAGKSHESVSPLQAHKDEGSVK